MGFKAFINSTKETLMKKRFFSFLILSSFILGGSVNAENKEEGTLLSYFEEEEYDTDDEYYFLVNNYERDEDEEYLAYNEDEDEYCTLASCAGGKCPREMVERLRKEKQEMRAKRKRNGQQPYDEDLSNEIPEKEKIC